MKIARLRTPLLAFAILACPAAHAGSYTCQLHGTMSGAHFGLAPDGQFLSGYGTYTCIELAEGLPPRAVETPVHLTFVGGGLGFDFALIHSVTIVADGIGDVHDPAELMGDFSVGAGLSLLQPGSNLYSVFHVKQRTNGIAFGVGLIGEHTDELGAGADGAVMRVAPVGR